MLTDFEGIIDSQGLCSLRQSQPSSAFHDWPAEQSRRVRFWAVIESESAIAILRELKSGSRARAYRLLEELAVSLGTQG